jgi:hypothetical protein
MERCVLKPRAARRRPQALWAVLTPAEAMRLGQALAIHFEDDPADPGWHHHVGSGDCELTIAIEADPESI